MRRIRRSSSGYVTCSYGSTRREVARLISSMEIPIPTSAGASRVAPFLRSHPPVTLILWSRVQPRVPGAPLLIRTGIGSDLDPGRINRSHRVSRRPAVCR